MWSVMLLGFLIGMKHAVEADHVAAVASLAARSRSPWDTVRLGAAWGLGHSLTLVAVGAAALGSGAALSAQVARGLELAVGAMLIVLGADVLRRLRAERIHFHVHRHADGVRHFHAHAHAHAPAHAHDPERHEHAHRRGLPVRAALVGLVHGMAGSAALILLTLQTLDSLAWALVYVALFSLGSVAGMALLSGLIALPLGYAARRLSAAYFGLQGAIGLGTIALGAQVLYTLLTP